MITKGQVAANPKEAAEMIAVLTKESDQLRAALTEIASGLSVRNPFDIANEALNK